MEKNIIVALDGMTAVRALELASLLKGKVWGFKLTDLLFSDRSIISRLKKYGSVFADAKLHDIPNTVAHQTRVLSTAGAEMISVHASGGVDMMREVKRASGRSKIIAVTVLTSQSGRGIRAAFIRLALDAALAGVDGIVCSAYELSALARSPRCASLMKVVPGIRPDWYVRADDQVRSATPRRALKWGADFLVIGRPVVMAKNPARAVDRIMHEPYEAS